MDEPQPRLMDPLLPSDQLTSMTTAAGPWGKTTSKTPLSRPLPGCHFSNLQLSQTKSRATLPLPTGSWRPAALLFHRSHRLFSAPCPPSPCRRRRQHRPRRKRESAQRQSSSQPQREAHMLTHTRQRSESFSARSRLPLEEP